MNKSYKCDFCKFDRPIEDQTERCANCKYGSNFELKKRMSTRQDHEWLSHRKLDMLLGDLRVVCTDSQKEFAHRLIEERPLYYNGKPRVAYSDELSFVMALFKEMVRSVKLEKEIV